MVVVVVIALGWSAGGVVVSMRLNAPDSSTLAGSPTCSFDRMDSADRITSGAFPF